MKILPVNWKPREYQVPLINAINSGVKRAVVVWHRRAGKDITLLNTVIEQMGRRVGIYYYVFPSYSQGRKILWDGMDAAGFRFMDHFPQELLENKNDNEMKIRLTNGSLFQIVGSDNIDSVVGTNPCFVVFSEYALQDPIAWDYIRPIVTENGGTAVFNYTPRGKNHGYQIYEMARKNPDWFCERLTVDDTKRPDGSPVISSELIDEARREGMSEELIQQEFYCDFQGSLEGSYYGRQISDLEKRGRITRVEHVPGLPVYTSWDLGIGDSTDIWFSQWIGTECRFIDHLSAHGEGFPYYAGELQRRNYIYAEHLMPHDVQVRELGSGKSRLETAFSLGIRPIRVVNNIPIDDGINAVRMLLPQCWFDAEKCERGLNALKNYRKIYDDKRKEFRSAPEHDWSSHAADSLRYMAVGFKPMFEYDAEEYEENTRSRADIGLGGY